MAGHYGADRGALGRNIQLGDQEYRIIGVMGPDRGYPSQNDSFWLPWHIGEAPLLSNYWTVARIREGISRAEAQKQIAEHNAPYTFWWPSYSWSSDFMSLAVAVLLLLAVACVNCASLITARGLARQRELALRGIPENARAGVTRTLLWESLFLALCGAAGGVALAYGGNRAFYALRPPGTVIEGVLDGGIDLTALGVAGAVALFSVLLFGLVPALCCRRGNGLDARPDAGADGPQRWFNGRFLLEVVEIALTTLLLAGAGSRIQNFTQIFQVDMGVRWDDKLIALSINATDPQPAKTGTQPDADQPGGIRTDVILEHLRAIPTVLGSTATWLFPMSGYEISTPVYPAAEPAADENSSALRNEGDLLMTVASKSTYNMVAPDFFQVAGVPLLGGRTFAASGNESGVIISEKLARRLWPGQNARDAVGKFVFVSAPTQTEPREIIGVCGNVMYDRYYTIPLNNDLWPRYAVYLPLDSKMPPVVGMTFVVRTVGDPQAILPRLKQTILAEAPGYAIRQVRVRSDLIQESLVAEPLFYMECVAFFALLALLLALSVVYALTRYNAIYRPCEISARIAEGATTRDIFLMRLWRGIVLSFVGIAAGVLLSFVGDVAGVLLSFNYQLLEMLTTDVLTLAIVASLMFYVTLAVNLVATWRATKTDPALTLKPEQ